LLLHSTAAAPTEKLPAWLEDGVILPREGLALALATIGKLKSEDSPRGVAAHADHGFDTLEIGYAKGHAHVTIKDPDEQVVFRMRAVDGKFPHYRKVIEDAARVLEGGERAPMSSISLDGTYVKQAAAIGAKLASKGLTPFVGTDTKQPVVISFLGVPDALYIIMPIVASVTDQMPTRTMALLGPAGLKGTLAALRATQTRQKAAMAECNSESTKKEMAAVITERDQRIAAVLQAMNGKALEAPKAPKEEPKAPVAEAMPTMGLKAGATTVIKVARNGGDHDPAIQQIAADIQKAKEDIARTAN
jgi:hypothetical protein